MSTKTNEQKYQKKTQREHVLLRPDTYVGDIEPTTEMMWIYDNNEKKMVKKEIEYVPGFYKVFDELLVNARDHSVNDASCNEIKVTINPENNEISVLNNGAKGIPVEMHKEHNMYIPSLIFGEMLTGSNFDDKEKRTTGGRNGYGAKLANIFSSKFIVDVVDQKKKLHFKQVFEKNMLEKNEPEVVSSDKKEKSYVKITFYPDLEKFKLKDISTDILALFNKRVYDIAATTSNRVKVYFNEEHLNVPSFIKYVDMYYPQECERIIDEENDRWKLCVLYLPNKGGENISYVNSICTYKGGTHVNYIVDNVVKRLINDYIKKKEKSIKVTPSLIKENLVFFINSVVENPAFISQTKDALTTKVARFGSTYEVDEKFMKKLAKTEIVNQVIDFARFKETAALKKTDGKKLTSLRGIPKLEDANKAGSKQAHKCSLILTEGDSAKAFAMAGLGIIGRNHYGVFPLKGKLLNVREAAPKQLLDNEEIKNIKQILGLQHNKDYTDKEVYQKLRYGKIVVLTDQDVDGSHIKGLLFNFFHYFWPSLMKKRGFLTSLSTPIVKAFKGKSVKVFYNLTDYEKWKNKLTSPGAWKIKYYKGLGTSTSKEAKEYFVDFEDKLINYFWNEVQEEMGEIIDDDSEDDSDSEENVDSETSSKSSESNKKMEQPDYTDKCTDAMTLAFDKRRADDRKGWLLNYDKENVISYEERDVSYTDFVHKDLIHFSNDDTSRSIPNVMDGFKPSQRKIMFGALKRKLYRDEVKVAQLSGYVSDKAAYHHGEASLQGAIIGMAQNYVGSNNINILDPEGQFGTRLRGGKDSASSRYIWTRLNQLTQKVFREEDVNVLRKIIEDGEEIEPEWYAPIIPMVLVNGAEGIGTGFSTKIPCYNPTDIIDSLLKLIDNKEISELVPWYQNFRGTITKLNNSSYEVKGVYHIKDEKTLVITELPLGEWTSNYKEFLDSLLLTEEKSGKSKKVKGLIESFTDENTDKAIKFTLTFPSNKLFKLVKANTLEKKLKLIRKINITNMHLFNADGTIKKFSNAMEIIKEYYDERLKMYYSRKEYLLKLLNNEMLHLKYKVLFIKYVLDKKIIINNKTKQSVIDRLEELEFPQLSKDLNAEESSKSYNYITLMQLFSLTKEKIDELNKEFEEKNNELDDLENKEAKDIWKDELKELSTSYKRWYKANNEEYLQEIESMNADKNTKSKKKKKKVTKKKKGSKSAKSAKSSKA
ncbi:DNA gyrase/topoisomerase IV, subunit A [seawater metagenome]|uniref:DNA topoisomerase (ATP-hydrolyzing) n=1 Tax=seawater metagenome TaxID=1561972 RepID=A0A5E8CIC5_9ZZZZ